MANKNSIILELQLLVFMNTPFVIERAYNASASKIWKALTDKNEMKQWYFNLSDFKPEVGFEFQFPGQGHKGENYLHLCKVTEVIPERRLAYSWRYKDHQGNSVVTFELFPGDGNTRLKLTHEGLETFPDNPDFARESFAEGWTQLIGTSLKEYLEKR
jgi:uncharacterized protein YndB with AHSA1/START domain